MRTFISRYIAASLAPNENISSSSVWSKKSVCVRILRTTGNVTSFVSTRYAPALPDSKAGMNKIESNSQSWYVRGVGGSYS